jgi:predicted PurR-regulated permease PerM
MMEVLNDADATQPSIPKSPDLFFERVAKLTLLGLLVYSSLTVVRPFLTIMLWTLILTVTLNPAFNWIAWRLGERRRLAAVITTLLSLAVVTGPIIWIGLSMMEGLGTLSERISAGAITIPAPPDEVKAWPLVGERLHHIWTLATIDLKSALTEGLPYLDPLKNLARKIAQSAATGIPTFMAALLASGFLFSAAPNLLEGARRLIRSILPVHGQEYINLAGATIRNVSQGVIGIALLQTILSGVAFAIAGVPGSGLLALAVFIFGILQLPGIVLIPAIIWGWASLTPPAALAFTVYMLPVTLINNVLSPIVMARGLQTPTIVIFIGVLGGLAAHGVIGLFVGPIILAVTWELVLAWVEQEVGLPSGKKVPDA